MQKLTKYLLLFFFSLSETFELRPQDSETRETKFLDGVWKFRLCSSLSPTLGFDEKWYETPFVDDYIWMPVPSSYNDITQNSTIRDHVGWVWYQRSFFLPKSWSKKKIWLRFDGVSHEAIVYVNGQLITSHVGGHLPFSAIVSNGHYGLENYVTVAVNNTLTNVSLPQGSWKWQSYPSDSFRLETDFDFKNYAGIHRHVRLYTTPKIYIQNVKISKITVSTNYRTATVIYSINHGERVSNSDIYVRLEDSEGLIVANTTSGTPLFVKDPKLWWPHLLTKEKAGYLYTLVIQSSYDVYRLRIGLRELSWNESGLYINHKFFYFRGFGKHEDSDFRGKGLDLPLIAKDFNLIKWMGANSFRTSHYPYAEEILDFADEEGIVVISESPGVALDNFSSELLLNHKKVMEEMIFRDQNRACVAIWSIANEPKSFKNESGPYFQSLVTKTRELDTSRPVMIVVNSDPEKDFASLTVDFVGINKYFGWYSDTGHIENIAHDMENIIYRWKKIRNQPILVTEYGADTIAGFHGSPSSIFTEEFQGELMIQNFVAFDKSFINGSLMGEMIWNFADFMTKETITRVVGNKKGIFTRQREPKLSAHILRKRYWSLSSKETNSCYSPSFIF